MFSKHYQGMKLLCQFKNESSIFPKVYNATFITRVKENRANSFTPILLYNNRKSKI